MRYFLILVSNMVKDLTTYFRTNSQLAKIKAKNPSCRFYEGAQILNSSFGDFNVIFYDTLVINSSLASHTYIQRRTNIYNAEIGKFCSIAQGVTIGPGIHKLDGVSTHPSFYLKDTPLNKIYSKTNQIETFKKTIIGNDVWIGEKVIIMDGVIVGSGAIIASGAVVTKDVLPYSIVGGIPAKHIKFRFDQDLREKLLKSKWWDNSEEWLEKNSHLFSDPLQLITK